MYGIAYMFRYYIVFFRERSYCLLRDAELRSIDRILWMGVLCLVTPIHIILSTDPQLRISQKALGTLPEDGNVMPNHVGATIINKRNE
jgi:hypothetical protein